MHHFSDHPALVNMRYHPFSLVHSNDSWVGYAVSMEQVRCVMN
jgi:hypothetical protein